MTTTTTNPITDLADPRMRIRSAYGTRAGALLEYMDCDDRGDDAATNRAYRVLVDACDDQAEAGRLIALARRVMSASCADRATYNMHVARAALEEVLGL